MREFTKDEIKGLLEEQDKLQNKKDKKTMTDGDKERDKELYFLMKSIPNDAKWKEVYSEHMKSRSKARR